MKRLSDNAIDIVNDLHTERLDYNSEYLPLIDALNKLAEYEDAEEQGLLVRLPCKVGDTVYVIDENKIRYGKVKRFYQHSYTKTWYVVTYDYFPDIRFDEFGKTAFLTREEAERALKEGV